MNAFEKLRERLELAFRNARATYEADKGKPSAAFDSGRYDGLKEALAILDECEPKAKGDTK
jgi:hypothetical protein